MAAEIKVGDTVTLKSGSPDMTVECTHEGADGLTYVTCRWYDFNGKQFHEQAFPATSLRHKPENNGPRTIRDVRGGR